MCVRAARGQSVACREPNRLIRKVEIMFNRTHCQSEYTNVRKADSRPPGGASALVIDRVQRLFRESGAGLSLVGQQVHSELGDDFYVHLLYYHLELRCHVIVELRSSRFDIAFLGSINFFMRSTDRLMCHPDDGPTIGILLYCSDTTVIARYALRSPDGDVNAKDEVRLVKQLPEPLSGCLPTVSEMERALCAR